MTRRTASSTAPLLHLWILLLVLALSWLPAQAQRLAIEPGIASAVVQSNTNHPIAPSTATYSGPASSYVPYVPLGGAFDSAGNMYFYDSGTIHVIASGNGPIPALANPSQPNYVASPVANTVYQVAGNGYHNLTLLPGCTGTDAVGDGCFATQAWINNCGQGDVTVDLQGNVFVADTCDYEIRVIYAKGNIPNLPSDPAVGMIYAVAGTGSHCAQNQSTCSAAADGPALSVDVNGPVALDVDGSDNIYIVDSISAALRVVYSGQGNVPGLPASPQSGYLYTIVGQLGSACTNTFANGPNDCGDNGPANLAQLNSPQGVHLDASGNIYIGDTSDNRLRAVYVGGNLPGVSSPIVGDIYTVAGNPSLPDNHVTEGVQATQTVVTPVAVTVDRAGDIYFADRLSGSVQRIDANGIITLAMGGARLDSNNQPVVCASTSDTVGDGCASNDVYFNFIGRVFVDPAGNVYGNDTYGAIHKSDLSTTSLNFSETVGFTANQTAYLYNTDTQPLQLSGLTLPPYFVQASSGSSDCSSSTVLSPATSCVLQLGYTAPAAGTNTGTLTIASDSTNAASGQNTIALAGTAAQDTTTTALVVSTVLANVNQPVTFTATVSGQFGSTVAPTGTVTFMNGTATLGTAPLGSNGVATFTASSLAAGAYSVYASYGGDTNCLPSASYVHPLTVSSTPVPVVTLTASASTVSQGNALTLNVTAASYSGSAVPTGTVTFQDGSAVLGSATLNNGTATFSISSLPVGANTLYANYGGDGTFTATLSSGVPVQITAAAPQAQIVPGIISTLTNLFATWVNTDNNGNIYYVTSDGAFVIASGKGPIAGVSNPVAGTTYPVVSSFCASYQYPCNVPGPAANAGVGTIYGLQVDAASNVYLLATGANGGAIYKINGQTDGIADVTPSPTAIVGNASASSPALSSSAFFIYLDNSANLYIADYGNSDIVRVDAITGVMTVVAGTPGVPCASLTTPCGDGGPATNASLSNGAGNYFYIDASGNIYLIDLNAVRKIDAKTGIINTIAGNFSATCTSAPCGDGGPATQALFNQPIGITGDAGGNLYIADQTDSAVRRIDTQGNISTIAGTILQQANGVASQGDNGPATSAPLYQPAQMAFDPQGNMYILIGAYAGGPIREVTAATTAFSYSVATTGPAGTQTATITNTTDVPLHLTGISIADGFVQQPVGPNDCAGAETIAPGGFCTLGLAFFPTASGATTGSVNIADDSSNASSGLNVISLSGAAPTGLSQTITFAALPDQTYAKQSITLNATASSGNGVTYAVMGPATVANNILTITGAGKVTVTAYQFGGNGYAPAQSVPQSFNVAPVTLTVTASSFSCTIGQVAQCLQNNPLSYTITGFLSGDTQSVVSGAATLSTTATASSGEGYYPITFVNEALAASGYIFSYVPGNIIIGQGQPQTITFATLPNLTYGMANVQLSATASSTLPVYFTASGPAQVIGQAPNQLLSITGAGIVTVTAHQDGNLTYASATSSQTIQVTKAVLTVTANNQTMAQGDTPSNLTYSVTGLVNGDSQSVITGTPILTPKPER